MWRNVRLGEIIDIFDNRRIPLNSRERGGRAGPYPYYGAQGIIDHIDSYIFDGRYLLVPEDGENLRSRKLPIAYFAEGKFWVNNHAHIVRGRDGIADDEFLKHLINNLDINAYVTGAAQPKLSQENLKKIEVRIPLYQGQVRISEVLSCYDNLMDNNVQRIAILEEMSRRLFEELRNGSRERTSVVPLGDIADEANGTVRTGPFGSQLHEADYKLEGIPVVMPKDIINGRVSAATAARIDDDTAGRLDQHRLLEGDIVYGRRGDIGRRALIRRRQAGYLCGTGCLRISIPEGRIKSRYLFAFLGLPEVVADIAGKAVGATMPNLNTSILRSIGIEVPPPEVQERFVGLVEPLDDLAEGLIEANQRLRTARDLLLPKLISGEINVGDAPLPGELAAE